MCVYMYVYMYMCVYVYVCVCFFFSAFQTFLVRFENAQMMSETYTGSKIMLTLTTSFFYSVQNRQNYLGKKRVELLINDFSLYRHLVLLVFFGNSSIFSFSLIDDFPYSLL